MDLRKQKTQNAIRSAFLQLRKEKNLEQITVKELAELAQISKATFYLHYRDIFDLSEQLQQEAIQNVLTQVASPLRILHDLPGFVQELTDAMAKDDTAIPILFSGSQTPMLPMRLEAQIKKHLFTHAPHLEGDAAINVLLSYHFQGSFYAFMENVQTLGYNEVLRIIKEIQASMPPQSTNKAQN